MNGDERLLEQLLDRLATLIGERLVAGTQAATSGEVGETSVSPWMNVATAATYLDWPRQRLYKLTAQGAIPHYKQEGRLLFHRQELDHWLARFRQAGGDWINPDFRAISR
jgi:excisionase family DNA binding protein